MNFAFLMHVFVDNSVGNVCSMNVENSQIMFVNDWLLSMMTMTVVIMLMMMITVKIFDMAQELYRDEFDEVMNYYKLHTVVEL